MQRVTKFLLIFILIIGFTTSCGQKEESKNNNNNQDVSSGYALKYDNMTITPGDVFTKDKFGEYEDYIELESCAFEDKDRAYTYEHFEISTYTKDKQEHILSVYFLDPEVTTTEGVALGDDKSKMLEDYGDGYTNNDSEYEYQKDKSILIFILNDEDIITSIEYRYDI